MGVEPVRIDLLTAMDGLNFESCWAERATPKWSKQLVNVLSASDLVKNKRKVGRPQDLLDVERLRALRKKK